MDHAPIAWMELAVCSEEVPFRPGHLAGQVALAGANGRSPLSVHTGTSDRCVRREPAVRGAARASHCGIVPCDSGPHTNCLGSSARDTATTNSYQHEYFRGIGRMMTRPGRWCPVEAINAVAGPLATGMGAVLQFGLAAQGL